MNKELEKRLSNLGFKELYIRNVPFGVALTPDNYDKFDLRNSGAFARIEDNLQIVPGGSKGTWVSVTPSPEGKYLEDPIFGGYHDLEDILKYLENEGGPFIGQPPRKAKIIKR